MSRATIMYFTGFYYQCSFVMNGTRVLCDCCRDLSRLFSDIYSTLKLNLAPRAELNLKGITSKFINWVEVDMGQGWESRGC